MHFTDQDFANPKSAKNRYNHDNLLLAKHLVLPSRILSNVCFLNEFSLTIVKSVQNSLIIFLYYFEDHVTIMTEEKIIFKFFLRNIS